MRGGEQKVRESSSKILICKYAKELIGDQENNTKLSLTDQTHKVYGSIDCWLVAMW
jgi:hypothetical protein